MDVAQFVERYADDWAGLAIAGTAGVVAAIVLCFIVFAAVDRVARHNVLARCLVARIRQPAFVAAPLVALQLLLGTVDEPLPALPLAVRAVSILLIAALTWLVLRAVSAIGDAVIELHPSNVSDNLEARRVATQTRVLTRTLMFVVVVIGAGAALMTFPNVRQVGASLLASAGVAGLVAGIAARPVIGNLIAGLQIALTQPIRLDDVVIVEGQWGRIEEITATYVVVKIWDERRLVVPLQWVIEHPSRTGRGARRSSSAACSCGSITVWTWHRCARR